MKTRNGKIARLPRAIRNQLNSRLDDGDPGQLLVDWLNGLPEVRHTLAEHFASRPISEQNLSEWKAGGFQEWLDQQTALELAGRIAENTDELAVAAGGPLTDKMALWVAARYLVTIHKLEAAGADDEAVWKRLRGLCRDVVALRRGDHHAERLRLDREIFREERRDHQFRALELCLEESKEYPEAASLFQEAFQLLKLLRQRKGRPAPDNQTQSDPIKPAAPAPAEPAAAPISPAAADQTQSDPIKPIKSRNLPPRTRQKAPKTVVRATSIQQSARPITGAASLIPPIIPLPPNPTQSDLIQPIEQYQPDPDPEKEAYNRWFRMNRGIEPFDYDELQKLYAAIPKKPEPA